MFKTKMFQDMCTCGHEMLEHAKGMTSVTDIKTGERLYYSEYRAYCKVKGCEYACDEYLPI